MAEPLRAVFRRPFPEAVAALRLRLGDLVPTARWDDVFQEAHNRAWMVAGATKADLLADIGKAVLKARTEGTTLEEFRRDWKEIIEKHGWHGWTGEGTAAGRAWRTRVIYRTNMRVSYAAGRYAQLKKAGFTYWIYRHGGSLEPRLQHLGWDGLILEADHPFWATHYPPNGWGCSCYVTGARSTESARRRGGDPDVELGDDWQSPDPKTGAPEGIDRGWAYAPGRSVAEDVAQMVAEKTAKLPAQLGAALAANTPPPRTVKFADLEAAIETLLKTRPRAEAKDRIEKMIARLPEGERPMAEDMLRAALAEKL